MLSYQRALKPFARQLSCAMTDAEQLLWRKLRRRQIYGIQFYRQKPIGPFIVDFYAKDPLLIIEVDGSQHLTPNGIEKDKNRDLYLTSLGFRVLRFNNREVLKSCDSVLNCIVDVILELKNTPPA